MNMDEQIYARTAGPDEVAEAARQAKKAKTARTATITKTVLDDGQDHSQAFNNPFAKGGLFDTTDESEHIVDGSIEEMSSVAVGAVITGVVAAVVLCFISATGIFASVCNQSVSVCSTSVLYGTIVTMVVSTIVGLLMLVQRRVYRPALVMLATVVAMWPVVGWMLYVPWYIALVAITLLFTISICVFTWIARLRNVAVALGAVAAIVALVYIATL